MGGFYSTPLFELFRRGLITQTVKRFRGINAYLPLSSLGPEWAQDCLNVVVASSGLLSKLRFPATLTPAIGGVTTGPQSFWEFQQANGTRQVLAQFGNSMYNLTNDLAVATLVETNTLNAGMWSMVEANNILFGANGSRMQKWTGTNWQIWGIVAPSGVPVTPISTASLSSIGRTSNVVTVTLNGFNPLLAFKSGDTVVISGVTDTSFNGTFGPITVTNLTTFTYAQTAANASSSGGTAAIQGALSPLTGLQYKYAYKNSVTGHVGPASSASATSGPQTSRMLASPIANTPTDTQIDSVVWFRTQDGGGDYFRVAETVIATGAIIYSAQVAGVNTIRTVAGQTNPGLTITDNTLDTALDFTIRAPLSLNSPPPQGTITARGQGRIFVSGITGAPQDIVYSGYEQILIGRPEESFPPQNRLRLSIGAESVAGMGVLQAGLVAFSNTGHMYMLRGSVEDITLAAPIVFSAFLEELPWTLGCLSHFTIQSTPYGLIWLAGDKTVQLFDGRSEPSDISFGVYPILRRVTPGSEGQCRSAYFNWLERDWYTLAVPIDGATTPNRIFFFALNADAREVDVFVSDINALFMGAITTSKLQRILLISNNAGAIQQLPVSADTVGGIADLSIIPSTPNNLNAFWRGGYFGNESPYRSKLWRRARLVSDQPPSAFKIVARLVDDLDRTLGQPEIIGPIQPTRAQIPINRRANRCSIELQFPVQDVSTNVLELSLAGISTSDR